MRLCLVVAAVAILGGCGSTGMVERPVAAGLVHEPYPVDAQRERDIRMSALHAVHPDPIRRYPDFVAATSSDLLGDDLKRLDALLAKGGNDFAALELTRQMIRQVRFMVERDERISTEAQARRETLLSKGEQ